MDIVETPVFTLEGVVKGKDELQDFVGPLTLILQLISKNKLEIRDVSVSLILEQYLAYLDRMAAMDLNIASEFVAMASHLMYIKTRTLLSGGEEVSELEQLISSLEELRRGDLYSQVKSAAETLAGMYSAGNRAMAGPPEYLPPDDGYKYLHEPDDLTAAILSVVGRENTLIGSINPREATYPRKILFSIPEKIAQLLEMLKQKGNVRAEALFYESKNRNELIATLIAVLELCRIGSVILTGSPDDISIAYSGAGREIAEDAELETRYG